MRNKRILTLITLLLFLLLLVGCKTTNQAPIITSIPITTVELGETYTYDVNATDPEGDTLTYSLITKPTGMTINSATGLIKWTPKAEGNFAVVVKVSDGVLYIIQSFTIVASKLPDPPAPPPIVNYAPIITSIPGDTAIIGVVYLYDVNATDPEGDVLIYSLTKKPDDMTINSTTGLISWTPASGQIGDNPVIVKVSDGEKATTQSFTITVKAVEPDPEIELTGIEVDPKTMTLFVGESEAIKSVTATYEIKGFGVPIPLGYCTYDLVNETVITVSDVGVVKAVGVGTATITVIYKGKVDTIAVTVNPAPLDYIIVLPETMDLPERKSEAITDGTTANIALEKCSYESSHKEVTVTDMGLVTAVAPPSATITVSYTEKGITKTDEIIVEVIAVELGYIVVLPETMDLIVGDTGNIISVTAHYVDEFEANIPLGDCTYVSNNEGVAIVGNDGAFTVLAVAVGEATITVNYQGKTDEITVTVNKLAGSYSYSWTTSIVDSMDFDFTVGMGWLGVGRPGVPGVYFFFHPDEIPLGGWTEPIGGAWLFEDIDFDITSAGQTFSVSDGTDFEGFANLLTNGTDEVISFGYMGDSDNIANGGGGQKGVQESQVFSGIDVGTDFPGCIIKDISLTFDQIYLDSANANKLVLDFTIDIYVGLPTP